MSGKNNNCNLSYHYNCDPANCQESADLRRCSECDTPLELEFEYNIPLSSSDSMDEWEEYYEQWETCSNCLRYQSLDDMSDANLY